MARERIYPHRVVELETTVLGKLLVGSLAIIALEIGGCATTKSSGGDASSSEGRTVPRTKDDLERIFENIFEVPEDAQIPANLLDPKTVGDAQDIVRSDNLALFARADRVFVAHLAEHPEDLANLTWHAQLYLAWADSALLTRKTLAGSVDKLRKRQEKLNTTLEDPELDDDAKAEAEAELVELGWLIPLADKAAGELERLADEKLAIGKEKTLAILDQHQETYEGYRLGADYYRLAEEWDRYETYIAELEEKNPDSNGLLFLRGVVAFQKEKDFGEAERQLALAVKNDPRFTKAQYYLALSYLNRRRFDDAAEAMEQTLKISPGHPFANAVAAFITRYRQHD